MIKIPAIGNHADKAEGWQTQPGCLLKSETQKGRIEQCEYGETNPHVGRKETNRYRRADSKNRQGCAAKLFPRPQFEIHADEAERQIGQEIARFPAVNE